MVLHKDFMSGRRVGESGTVPMRTVVWCAFGVRVRLHKGSALRLSFLPWL